MPLPVLFYGTIWVVTHRPSRQYNQSDLQVLAEIADTLYPLIIEETTGLESQFSTSLSNYRFIDGERRIAQKNRLLSCRPFLFCYAAFDWRS
jgi:hypothetical protein